MGNLITSVTHPGKAVPVFSHFFSQSVLISHCLALYLSLYPESHVSLYVTLSLHLSGLCWAQALESLKQSCKGFKHPRVFTPCLERHSGSSLFPVAPAHSLPLPLHHTGIWACFLCSLDSASSLQTAPLPAQFLFCFGLPCEMNFLSSQHLGIRTPQSTAPALPGISSTTTNHFSLKSYRV